MLDFFVNILKSEGLLSSIQFGFTALLTLLIPLIVVLYEQKRDIEYEIDKTVINQKLNFKLILLAILVSVGLILAYNNDKETLNYWHNFWIIISLTIPFAYLTSVNLDIATTLYDILPSRKKYLKEESNGGVLDFWEEYFIKLKDSKNTDKNNIGKRRRFKFSQDESVWLILFFEKVESLICKDPVFCREMIDIINENFETVNLDNLFYLKVKDSRLIEKLLSWHFEIWKIEKSKHEKRNEQDTYWHEYNWLFRNLTDLIKKIEITSLTLRNNYWYGFLPELKKHLEKYKNETYPIANKGTERYLYSLGLAEPFFENVSESSALYDIQTSNFAFPDNWRTSLQIDTEKYERKDAEEGKVSLVLFWFWWDNLLKWLRDKIMKSTSEEFDKKVDNVLRIFFPSVDEEFLSWLLVYGVKFSYRDENRISELIKNKPYFSFLDTYRPGVYRNMSELNAELKEREEIYKEMKLKACQIMYFLSRYTFDKNLQGDLKEIRKLKKDKNLTEQQQRNLKTVEQIWKQMQFVVKEYTSENSEKG